MDVSKALDCTSIEEQEIVSRYVGQKLSPEEAEAFEEHYFGCDRCWAEVQAATEVRAALSPEHAKEIVSSSPSSKTNWRLLAIAASVAIAVVAGLLVSRLGTGKTPVETVVAAAGSRRATEARLTGGFPHAEVETVTRGEGGPAKPWRLQKALEDAQREVESNPSAEAWRAVGVAELLLGDGHDQAVNTLKKAAEKYPNDAKIQSDLAAAYFARFEALGHDKDLETGYEAAAGAVKLDPKLPEARFNKALILERLGHRSTAAEEWNSYLKVERDKGWVREAARHVRQLSGRPLSEMWPSEKEKLRDAASRGDRVRVAEIVSRFPERSRQYVEDEVLPQWAEQSDTSSTSLAIAREVAEVFRTEHSDSFLADSVALINDSLGALPRSDTLSRVIEGHRLYGLARRCYKEPAIEEAHRLYGQAEDLLESAGSPFRDLAIVEGATCLFYENKPFPIVEAVAPVSTRSQGRYPQLFASSQWLRALAEQSLGHPSEALRAYFEALTAFQRVRDRENVGSVHYLIGEMYQQLGELGLAAQFRRQALTTLTQTGEPRRLYVAFHLAGVAAEEARLPELARLAYAGAVDSARRAKNPDLVTHALVASAKAENLFGNREVAQERLREAAAACRMIRDPGLRARASAELSVVASQFDARKDADRSFRELNSAATFFERRKDLPRIAAVRFERGKLYLARRNSTLATEDFLAAIGILESMRNSIPDETTRVSFFENAQVVFDHTIAALAAEGQVVQATQIVEQARARTLLDMIQTSVPAYNGVNLYQAPLREDVIRRRLPSGTAVVEYALLEERLLAFTIRATHIRITTIPVTSSWLQGSVGIFLDSLSRRETPPNARENAARSLYSVLIEPIRRDLEGVHTVIFVPDKSLNRLPFAALRNPRTGRYLVEEFRLGVSPSATIYVQGIDRYRRLAADQPEHVLLVANPRFDRKLLPKLKPLPGAEQEAHDVAALYADSVTLEGTQATRPRFVAEAPSASLIHFASHALIESNSIFSKLVLAPDPSQSDSGLFYAHEIAHFRFPHTRIVVLSACETLGGAERAGEGVTSLARAFLAAGVPAVLGTLAPVEDRVAAAMLKLFHRGLSEGRDPIEALRNAQLFLLRGPDPDLKSPAGWALYQLIGGSASS
jgi:CHAT domain-containing protein